MQENIRNLEMPSLPLLLSLPLCPSRWSHRSEAQATHKETRATHMNHSSRSESATNESARARKRDVQGPKQGTRPGTRRGEHATPGAPPAESQGRALFQKGYNVP